MAKKKKIGTVKINWKDMASLIQAGCTLEECAAYAGVHPDTLRDHCKKDNDLPFREFKQQNKATGKALLRQKQYAKAMKGDNTMMVWLGKNMLDQRDKSDTRVTEIRVGFDDEETPEGDDD